MDTMEIDDCIQYRKTFTVDGLVTKGDIQGRKSPYRCISVFLGLLCILLLAANVGQFFYYHSFIHSESAGLIQAAAQRIQLENTLKDMTEGKDQLQHNYNTLRQEKDQLQTNYDSMQKTLDIVQRERNELQTNRDQLQMDCTNVTQNKDQLQNRYQSLSKDKDTLQQQYNTLQQQKQQLTNEKEQLQQSYNTLKQEKDQLKSENDQLQRSKGTLQSEKDQLQTNYNSVADVRDRLQKKIEILKKRPCKSNWKRNADSCFYVSSGSKDWRSSRDYCISQGADLAILESTGEQAFVNGLLGLGVNAWIGLTDDASEGTWKWIDGTPVTTTYWESGQPNSHGGDQDCGELVQRGRNGEWNDETCSSMNNFICEQ